MPVILMWLDAFSEKYLSQEYTPFLYDLSRSGISSSLNPLFAFRGIETTIFTGLWPDEHGDWTEFKLREKPNGRLGAYKLLIKIADITGNDKVRKIARIAMQMLVNRASTRLTPNVIPVELMDYFELTQKKAVSESHARENASLFDMLKSRNLDFECFYPPYSSGDKGIVHSVSKALESRKNAHLFFMKMNKLDRIGHILGPEPSKFSDALREMDENVSQIVRRIESVYGECNILILADHGMSIVNNYTDMLSDLKKLNLKPIRDYLLFLDSTVARFWFNSGNARSKIIDYLNSLEIGHILSNDEMKRLHVPIDTSYGDVVFALHEGTVIYPDFWSGKRKPKGMHTYAYTKTKEGRAILIANKEMGEHWSLNGQAEYVEILPWVLNALGLSSA